MRVFVIGALLSSFVALSNAQDKVPTPDEIKKTVLENLSQAGFKDAKAVESENMILFSNVPEAKAKTQIDALQKVYVGTMKGLAFKEGEKPTAKVAVLGFPDPDGYKSYVRGVLKRSPGDETSSIDLKAALPTIAMSAKRGDKTPNFAEIGNNDLVMALLEKKGGNARLEGWMKTGFLKAVQMRLDPKYAGTERTISRKYAGRIPPKGVVYPTVLQYAWMAENKDAPALAATFMDWLTLGTGLEKLDTVLGLMLPPEGQDEARKFEDAVKAAELKLEEFDKPWREWVIKGSPVREEKKEPKKEPKK
jgi:hypothetical protein